MTNEIFKQLCKYNIESNDDIVHYNQKIEPNKLNNKGLSRSTKNILNGVMQNI